MLREDDQPPRDQWRLAVFVAESFSRSIEHADQKSALLSAAIGIIVLGAGESQKQLWMTVHPNSVLSIGALGIFSIFALLLALSALFVVLALFPRMFSSVRNPFYFGDAVRGDPEWFADQLLGRENPERLLIAGSHDLARIAFAKHSFFRRAAYFYAAALVAFLAWMVVATMALPEKTALG
jgi:pycsar effector protein